MNRAWCRTSLALQIETSTLGAAVHAMRETEALAGGDATAVHVLTDIDGIEEMFDSTRGTLFVVHGDMRLIDADGYLGDVGAQLAAAVGSGFQDLAHLPHG